MDTRGPFNWPQPYASSDQRTPRHFRRLRQAHEGKHCGGDVRQDAVVDCFYVASVHPNRHRIGRVGRVWRSVFVPSQVALPWSAMTTMA